MRRIKFLVILTIILTNLNLINAQVYTGVHKTSTGNTDYHHFVRDNAAGAAVYINQVSTGPILRLSSGVFEPNQSVKFTFENNGYFGLGTNTITEKLVLYKSDATQVTTQYGNLNTDIGSGNGFLVGIESAGNGIVWNRENNFIRFGTNSLERMRINANGNVGIGTTTPSEKLDIDGNIEIPGVNYYLKSNLFNYWGVSKSGYGYYGMCLRYKNDQWESFHSSINGMAMKFIANGIEFVTAPPNNIPATIRTLMRIKSDGDVTIDGKLISKEVEVMLDVWSDFVFNKDIPSEKEVLENGIQLGEMDAKLLQKIEELTLYMIDVNKRVQSLETENLELKNKLEQLETVE